MRLPAWHVSMQVRMHSLFASQSQQALACMFLATRACAACRMASPAPSFFLILHLNRRFDSIATSNMLLRLYAGSGSTPA